MSLQRKLEHWPSSLLSAAIIALAVALIFAALAIHNPWIKAGILAWEVLP